jgi:hypothetical protein
MDISVPLVVKIGRDAVEHVQGEIVREVEDDDARGAYLCSVIAFMLTALIRLQGRPGRTVEIINETLTEVKAAVRMTLVQ